MTDFTREHGLPGVISVCRLWDATPAAFCCHNIERDDSEDVMADYLSSNVDLAIGAGWHRCVIDRIREIYLRSFKRLVPHPHYYGAAYRQSRRKDLCDIGGAKSRLIHSRVVIISRRSPLALDYLRDQDKGFF